MQYVELYRAAIIRYFILRQLIWGLVRSLPHELVVTLVADLCHFVLLCFRGKKAKRRQAKTRQMVTFSCFRMATFRPATRKYDTFHASSFRLLFVVSLPGGAKGRHANPPPPKKTPHLAGFRVATFPPAMQRYDKQGRKRERSPRENPPNGDLFVFSHGDLSPRHTKVREIPCVAFSRRMVDIPFGGFSRGDFPRFRPENTFIRQRLSLSSV